MTKRIVWTDEEWMSVCVALRQIQGTVGAHPLGGIHEALNKAQAISSLHPSRYRRCSEGTTLAYSIRTRLLEVEKVLLDQASVTAATQPAGEAGALQALIRMRSTIDDRIVAAHAKTLSGDSGLVHIEPGVTAKPGVLDVPVSKVVQQALETMAPMLMEQISKDIQLSGLQQLQASVRELNAKMDSIIKAFDIPLEVLLAENLPVATSGAVGKSEQAPAVRQTEPLHAGTALGSEIAQARPAAPTKITRKVLIIGPTSVQAQALAKVDPQLLSFGQVVKVTCTKDDLAWKQVGNYDMVLVMSRFVHGDHRAKLHAECKRTGVPPEGGRRGGIQGQGYVECRAADAVPNNAADYRGVTARLSEAEKKVRATHYLGA